MDIKQPEATRKLGWRKLVRLKARPGSVAATHNIGSGIILLSLLMAAGLQGANVIATDALISIIISCVKLAVFGLAGVMNAQAVALALLIGAIALPGSFLAKLMVERMPLHVHSAILDAVVIVGGATMALAAFAR